jgi:hypothetical protein
VAAPRSAQRPDDSHPLDDAAAAFDRAVGFEVILGASSLWESLLSRPSSRVGVWVGTCRVRCVTGVMLHGLLAAWIWSP